MGDLNKDMKLVYPAFSKHLFYFKDHISKYVLENGYVPLNPFNIHGYFLLDTVPRDTIRCSNNNLVKRADELWIFGAISDGVFAEIMLGKVMNKPIKYFEIINSKRIVEISKINVKAEKGLERLLSQL